ncbi:MAG: DUF883 family protein [Hellea sp.]|nr:DUF883 family protein [Hellea sp.]
MATTPKKNVVEIKPDVSTQLEVLREDISELAKIVKVQAKETAQTKKAQIVDTASAKAAASKAKYDELTTTAETKIKENPLTAMAIAVGAGLFLGLISRR